MPFMAAAPALWGGIMAGAGTAGGMLGSAALNKSAANKALQQQGQQNYTTSTFAQEAANRSKPAFDKAYNYYSRMLDGDMSSLQPDIENTQQQFAQASRNLVNNAYARGGGLGRGLGQIEGQKAMTISDIMSRSRPQAASALAALASGDQSTALQALAAAQQGKQNSQMLQQQAYSGIGSFITRLMSTPGLFNMFSGSGQSGGAQPGSRYQYPQAFINATGTNPWGNLPAINNRTNYPTGFNY